MPVVKIAGRFGGLDTDPVITATSGRVWSAGSGTCRTRRSGAGAQLQAVPLRANPVGAVLSPVWLAWKPMVVEPPDGMAAL